MILLACRVLVLRYFTCRESDKAKKTLGLRFFRLLLMEELLWHHSRSGSVDEARTEGQKTVSTLQLIPPHSQVLG